jgi:hypothetical protein
MGEGGSRLVLILYIIIILARYIFINIRDTPMYKEELILLSLQAFPFWDDLTFWDSSCRDMTGIKCLLFYYIHKINW